MGAPSGIALTFQRAIAIRQVRHSRPVGSEPPSEFSFRTLFLLTKIQFVLKS